MGGATYRGLEVAVDASVSESWLVGWSERESRSIPRGAAQPHTTTDAAITPQRSVDIAQWRFCRETRGRIGMTAVPIKATSNRDKGGKYRDRSLGCRERLGEHRNPKR
jgi:hypothetical protein